MATIVTTYVELMIGYSIGVTTFIKMKTIGVSMGNSMMYSYNYLERVKMEMRMNLKHMKWCEKLNKVTYMVNYMYLKMSMGLDTQMKVTIISLKVTKIINRCRQQNNLNLLKWVVITLVLIYYLNPIFIMSRKRVLVWVRSLLLMGPIMCISIILSVGIGGENQMQSSHQRG